jgi:O-acetyl-ADP-ribose deacetylase (regulator of RNase III)
MQTQIDHTTLQLVQADITELTTDAIVNAANEHLAHGGGVAGVISRKGGPAIQRESNEWVRQHGPVRTGSAAITSGGRLEARHVIHAVGPIYDGTPRSAELLASAVRAALQMVQAAIEYLKGKTGLERVIFCLYGQRAFDVFVRELAVQTDQNRDA